MPKYRSLALIPLAAALAACGAIMPATRAVPIAGAVPAALDAAGVARAAAPLAIASVTVVVPRSLSVSEANSFFPVADIVWRGEPRGDRHAQVQAIVADAVAAARLTEGRPAAAEIVVARFHGVTERTRYTFGGTYAVRMTVTLRDAATGAVLDGPRPIHADIPAAGGQQAIEEESRGRTQRIVVVEGIAAALRAALAAAPAPVSRREDDLRLTSAAVAIQDPGG